MTEITIRNKEFLGLLDDTLESFLEHRELMTELSDNLKGIPIGEGEKYCQPEHLWDMMSRWEDHIGFPEEGYGFQVAQGVKQRPDVFAPLYQKTKYDLVAMFNANSNSLTSYYPPKGYVGWHTNWNAFGWQLILTWSEEGDGYFSYYDKEKDKIITEDDVKGWQARWYRFGRKDEPKYHCWHTAWTECPRFTLAFKFPYNAIVGHGGTVEQSYEAIQMMITEMETA